MFDMNWFINLMKKGYNPQQIMMSVLETKMGGTPMGDNLINLAKQGNTAEIEKIARNLTAQRGGNFDEEFKAFKQQLGLFK